MFFRELLTDWTDITDGSDTAEDWSWREITDVCAHLSVRSVNFAGIPISVKFN